jgi:hypothetical protein
MVGYQGRDIQIRACNVKSPVILPNISKPNIQKCNTHDIDLPISVQPPWGELLHKKVNLRRERLRAQYGPDGSFSLFVGTAPRRNIAEPAFGSPAFWQIRDRETGAYWNESNSPLATSNVPLQGAINRQTLDVYHVSATPTHSDTIP